MTKQLQKEIETLSTLIVSLGADIEQVLSTSFFALTSGDSAALREIIQNDTEIDRREVEIEEECLRLLAVYQPVAFNLRNIVAVLKINNELERIGDIAVSISRRTLSVGGFPPSIHIEAFRDMGAIARSMLNKALDSLVQLDGTVACAVCEMDDKVDRLYENWQRNILEELTKGGDVHQLTQLLFIARHLERIADHTTNIAEAVLYLTGGSIVRHQDITVDNRKKSSG